jgi:hypothetical protein
MWRFRLVSALVVVGIVLTGFVEWYESEHQAHIAGYSSLVPVSALIGIGAIELVKYFRDSAKSKGRLSGQTFLEEYTTLLTNAIEVLQDVHTYNEAQLLQAQTKILKLIAAVVILFHPEAVGLGINANLMLNEDIKDHSSGGKFADHVHFSDPQRAAETYSSVLCIRAWADPPQMAPHNFSVPVDKDPQRVLFGAPRTFVSGKEVVIPNIHNRKEVSKELKGQPEVVCDTIHAFFGRQKYKTFMSITVKNSDKTVAILNLQADQIGVFGSRNKQEEVKRFIDPFCTILGIIATQSLTSGPAPRP